jgi:integrase
MPLSEKELVTVLKQARATSARDWAMTLLSWRHGMRASEIVGLKLTDVDMKTGEIVIRRKKNSLTSHHHLEKVDGRPEMDEKKALRAYFKVRPESDSEFLFLSRKGKNRMTTVQWWRRFRDIAKKAGITDGRAHPHTLKTSMGSLLANDGQPVTMIQQTLGHRSLNSSLFYMKATPRQAERSVRKALADMF